MYVCMCVYIYIYIHSYPRLSKVPYLRERPSIIAGSLVGFKVHSVRADELL